MRLRSQHHGDLEGHPGKEDQLKKKLSERTRKDATWRQIPLKSRIFRIFPIQSPPSHPTPVTAVTLSSRLQSAILDLALLCAAFHASPKSGRTLPESETGGGFWGSVSGKMPETGVSEGTGKCVKGNGVMGRLLMSSSDG